MSFFRMPTVSKSETVPLLYKSGSRPTRVDNFNQLSRAIDLVEKIRSKVKELERDWPKKGAGSTDYEKFVIMQVLLADLDKSITAFNDKNQQPELEEESKDVKVLVGKLLASVDALFQNKEYAEVIKTKRNEGKDNARAVTDVGLVGSAATLAAWVPYSFPVGALLCGAGAGVGSLLKKHFDLTNLDTASQTILTALHTELGEIDNKLNRSIIPSPS